MGRVGGEARRYGGTSRRVAQTRQRGAGADAARAAPRPRAPPHTAGDDRTPLVQRQRTRARPAARGGNQARVELAAAADARHWRRFCRGRRRDRAQLCRLGRSAQLLAARAFRRPPAVAAARVPGRRAHAAAASRAPHHTRLDSLQRRERTSDALRPARREALPVASRAPAHPGDRLRGRGENARVGAATARVRGGRRGARRVGVPALARLRAGVQAALPGAAERAAAAGRAAAAARRRAHRAAARARARVASAAHGHGHGPRLTEAARQINRDHRLLM